MKRIISLILALVLCLSLCACSISIPKDQEGGEDAGNTSETAGEVTWRPL